MSRLTKKTNILIDQYCINCIQDDNTDGMSDNQKILHLWDRFQKEADWDIKRIGTLKAFSEWLSSLPILVDFWDCDVLRLAELWGQSVETERQKDNIIFGWWDFMANRYLRLIRKVIHIV
jgi:hypothetical protein